MKEMKRKGYGSQFNNIFFDATSIIKHAKNEYGIEKMKKEICFYKNIQEKNILYSLLFLFLFYFFLHIRK